MHKNSTTEQNGKRSQDNSLEKVNNKKRKIEKLYRRETRELEIKIDSHILNLDYSML